MGPLDQCHLPIMQYCICLAPGPISQHIRDWSRVERPAMRARMSTLFDLSDTSARAATPVQVVYEDTGLCNVMNRNDTIIDLMFTYISEQAYSGRSLGIC